MIKHGYKLLDASSKCYFLLFLRQFLWYSKTSEAARGLLESSVISTPSKDITYANSCTSTATSVPHPVEVRDDFMHTKPSKSMPRDSSIPGIDRSQCLYSQHDFGPLHHLTTENHFKASAFWGNYVKLWSHRSWK